MPPTATGRHIPSDVAAGLVPNNRQRRETMTDRTEPITIDPTVTHFDVVIRSFNGDMIALGHLNVAYIPQGLGSSCSIILPVPAPLTVAYGLPSELRVDITGRNHTDRLAELQTPDMMALVEANIDTPDEHEGEETPC